MTPVQRIQQVLGELLYGNLMLQAQLDDAQKKMVELQAKMPVPEPTP